MMSISTPFSASTMRLRWLCGSSGAENSVMTERRDMDHLPCQRRMQRLNSNARLDRSVPVRSMHVFPVFPLEHPGKARQNQQEQYDPDTEPLALDLRRLADVVEEIDSITHATVELLGSHVARQVGRKMIEHL